MKRWFLCTVILCLLLGMGQSVFAQKADQDNMEKASGVLQSCTDTGLGIVFDCSADWKIQTVDDAVLVIISSDPDVAMIIARIDSGVKFLGQLTKEKLKDLKQYKEGFVVENVEFKGRDVLKVKAFSDEYPDRRLLDYYLIHDEMLYGILFSVEPKDAMDTYQYLFKDIVENFAFLE